MILKQGDSSEDNKYIETQGGKGSPFFPLSPNLEKKLPVSSLQNFIRVRFL